MSQLQTPVAFFIFNRPDTTARVFAEIARARPSKLIVVADGPRAGIPEEAELCTRTRAEVQTVDWKCEVITNYSDRNLGCKARVSSGLDFVFDQVEEAIILEDDCLPHPSFFLFCESLLQKYRDDERVMVISGDNFHRGRRYTPFSYFFSQFAHIWGWASWRRAWSNYDVDIREWSTLRDTDWLHRMLQKERNVAYWRDIFDKLAADEIDTWDYQWLFSCWTRGGLSITPEVNLVSNIGFGGNATHTNAGNIGMANLPLADIGFPLKHPPVIEPNRDADEFESQHLFSHYDSSLYARFGNKVSRVLNRAKRNAKQ